MRTRDWGWPWARLRRVRSPPTSSQLETLRVMPLGERGISRPECAFLELPGGKGDALQFSQLGPRLPNPVEVPPGAQRRGFLNGRLAVDTTQSALLQSASFWYIWDGLREALVLEAADAGKSPSALSHWIKYRLEESCVDQNLHSSAGGHVRSRR